MNWSDIRPWVAKFAPFIGAALGPMGTVAGGIIGKVLGVENPTPDTVAKALADNNLTPEQVAALKQEEYDFQIKMTAMGYDSAEKIAELEFKDRDSARSREIQVRDHTPAIGFYLITAGFFGLLAMMLFHVIPEGNTRVLDVMVGSLGTAWIGCTSYYYGTTKSSLDKNIMLYNSQPKQ